MDTTTKQKLANAYSIVGFDSNLEKLKAQVIQLMSENDRLNPANSELKNCISNLIAVLVIQSRRERNGLYPTL
jgi:hypothetical protein